MHFRLSLVTLIFAFSAFGTPIKRGATRVESDVQTMDAQTNTLDAAINNLTGSNATLIQAQTIHEEAVSLGSNIRSATADVIASSPFDKSQATTMLDKTQKLANDIANALKDLDAKKNTIEKLKLTNVVAEDLASLGNDTKVFGVHYMAKIPKSMSSIVQAQINTIAAAFGEAMRTYP